MRALESYLPSMSSFTDVTTAALRLKDFAQDIGPLSISLTCNIARQLPVRDAEGNALEDSVFQCPDHRPRWYLDLATSLTHPITQAIRVEGGPFVFRRRRFRSWYPNPLLDMIKVPKSGANPLLRPCIVTPVHMSLGVIGALNWSTDDESVDVDAIYERHVDTMMALARRFITGYRHVASQAASVPKPGSFNLTRREVECLQWAALGKTDGEIGVILSLSVSTVRFHLYNAARKLGTVNRAQTAHLATQLGFVSFLS